MMDLFLINFNFLLNSNNFTRWFKFIQIWKLQIRSFSKVYNSF